MRTRLRVLPRCRAGALTAPDGATVEYVEWRAWDPRMQFGWRSETSAVALIIGGEDNRMVVGREAQEEAAALMPNSRLVLYPRYGRGSLGEQPDYEYLLRAFAEEAWFRGERPR